MAGIVSYGGYIPMLRLDRGTVFFANAWKNPALFSVAQGERSMCNWDEDSVTMAVEASRDCIKGLDKGKVDALYLASLSFPFQDRQNAGIVATALNLKDAVETADFAASMRAGASALLAGLNAVKSGECETVLVAAADKRPTKSAFFHEMWFGDGAASLLLGNKNVIAEMKGSFTVSYDFVDHFKGINQEYDYFWEERWVRDEGFGKIAVQVVDGLLKKLKISGADVSRFVMPCVFGREPVSVAKKFGIEKDKVADNLHKVCGETGTAHSLVMLAVALQDAKPGDKILLVAFGQGASAFLFEVTPEITKLAPRVGIKGYLAQRREEKNYLKFLTFNELVVQENGMRAEADWKTALSTLYRKRKMILGLVGGMCTKCKTPQFPKSDVCVNPDCGAHHTQEDHEFAEQQGKIKTWSSDLLTYCVDPPAHYGMIEFDNGGQFMCDFTDHEIGKVEVGMPVEMVFRVKNVDPARGFTRYFWKAKPLITSGQEA
ncbi:MAG TPA: hydroxymethylglutaryl-CoA synthase family protein [Spirochaetes bacterium]|nr:hydroxymethylglutaryl-CoA synthase family protein [Spirochaetota bacterium]